MGYTNKKFRRIQPMTAFTIIVVAALSVFLIGVGIWRFKGAQNTSVILSSGEELKYVGLVDKLGRPISGTLYFANGISAQIDVTQVKVTYSDGTVSYGPLYGNYKKTGNGSITLPNGDTYEGDFLEDSLTGYGKFTFAGGDVYEGELQNGKKEGKGKYTSADGSIYEGDFKNDQRHGKGKHTSADGSVYEGDFKNGIKSGYGKYVYANGDVYEGEFKGDLREGDGKYCWANGETYTGQFKKGNMYGFGTYTWPTGRASYTGYFENGVIVVIDPQ
jgi:hypothetical protein